MSREFRPVSGYYMHQALCEAADPETKGTHRITHALTDLYKALYEIEYASASYECHDGGVADIVMALQLKASALNDATHRLIEIYKEDADLIRSLLRADFKVS